jgi:hypothetical protein
MKQMKRNFLAVLVLALTIGVLPSAAWSSVSFTDGEYVKLGYTTATPPVWEVKELPGAMKNLFLGASLAAGGGYGDTNDWLTSNVRRHLNANYLTAHFSPDELATGVLTPYGNTPIYDVTVPEMTYSVLAKKSGNSGKIEMTPKAMSVNATIPPSSAGDSLIWILDVQEIQAIFNLVPDLPWNDTAGYPARTLYAAGGPYRTRSADLLDPLLIWTLNTDGSFSREPVSAAPSYVRPVVSPDTSVMLYKPMSTT